MSRDILDPQMGILRTVGVDNGCAQFVTPYSDEGLMVFHEGTCGDKGVGMGSFLVLATFGWEYVDRILIMGR